MQQLRPGQGHGVQAGAEAGEGGVQPRAGDLSVPGVGGQRVVAEVGGEQPRQPGHRGQGVVVHQTVAGQVEVLEAGQLGHGEQLLNVIVCEHQAGERRGLVCQGHVGQMVVGEVQVDQLSQAFQTSRVYK